MYIYIYQYISLNLDSPCRAHHRFVMASRAVHASASRLQARPAASQKNRNEYISRVQTIFAKYSLSTLVRSVAIKNLGIRPRVVSSIGHLEFGSHVVLRDLWEFDSRSVDFWLVLIWGTLVGWLGTNIFSFLQWKYSQRNLEPHAVLITGLVSWDPSFCFRPAIGDKAERRIFFEFKSVRFKSVNAY